MKQPKFTYKQRVNIVKGFYRGREATVFNVIDLGFLRTKWHYILDVEDLLKCISLQEDEIEEIKLAEKCEVEK